MAAAPARLFESRDEAIARYLKVSGLSGLIAPDSPEAAAGIAQCENKWRLACDPATASIGAPAMPALIAAARAPIHLARGKTDMMVTRDQLREYDPQAPDLPGGHNAMVENASAIWDWVEGHLA
ncbi:MAG: hypothetical protein ABSC92_12030 [Rhizomicrobium sp.]